MLVIGLTGGIGSGKSTVAHLFAEKGVTIIDTDRIARDLTQIGQAALKEIIAHFGETILLPDHTLDRSQLRKIIFTYPAERLWLEKLLHPLIREQTRQEIALAKPPYCIVVIPLLFETQPNPLIQRILVVDATEEQQLERTQIRDKLSKQEVQAIAQTQVPREKRLTMADDVIYNQGNLQELQEQVEKYHAFYSLLV